MDQLIIYGGAIIAAILGFLAYGRTQRGKGRRELEGELREADREKAKEIRSRADEIRNRSDGADVDERLRDQGRLRD